VKMLLDMDGIDLNPVDRVGKTPLLWAARERHKEIVKMLVAMDGIDLSPVDEGGMTPLAWAATKGHKKIVKMLQVAIDNINVKTTLLGAE
jgi:ankyrin repeat protein